MARPREENSIRSVAEKAGIAPNAVVRKRQQGKTDEQIIEEGRLRGEKFATEPPSPAEAPGISEGIEDPESLREAMLRKERANADIKEMEAAQMRGELVNVEEAAKAWEQAGSQINSEMLNIPDRVAMRLVGKNARDIREVLMTEIRKALLIVSDKLRAA